MCTGYSTLCSWCGLIKGNKKARGRVLKNLGSSLVLSHTCFITPEAKGSGIQCLLDLGQMTFIYL